MKTGHEIIWKKVISSCEKNDKLTLWSCLLLIELYRGKNQVERVSKVNM